MVDLAIGAAISGLKTAGEIAGSFVKLRDEALIQAKVIELQSVILSAQGSALAAQGEQFALLEQKRSLEKQIADLEAWEREAQRYQLEEVGQGSLAYTIKQDAKGSEPSHMLCANCYQQHNKAILQRRKENHNRRPIFGCPLCETEIVVDIAVPPERAPMPQIRSDYDPFSR